MVLGVSRAVRAQDAEPGRFYICQSYGMKSVILQCISNEQAEREEDRKLALLFTNGDKNDIYIGGFPSEILVELEEVQVRVDPPSISGSKYSTSIRSGMLLLSNDSAILAASTGGSGSFSWATINISEGCVQSAKTIGDWVSFSRWSLVVLDDGEEIEIATFEHFER